MLNGACKYREPRHKGCAKAERGAEVGQAERRTEEGKRRRRCTRLVHHVLLGQKDSAFSAPSRKREDRKEVGGSTKGCFNSLLSSVWRSGKKKK